MKSPIVCRAGDLPYAWQPSNPESAIEYAAALPRIESPLDPAADATPEPPPRVTPTMTPPDRCPSATKPETAPDPTSTGLAALIREAESLGAARTRSQKLVVALRRRRKQARSMAATLNTLRQFKLQEVAE